MLMLFTSLSLTLLALTHAQDAAINDNGANLEKRDPITLVYTTWVDVTDDEDDGNYGCRIGHCHDHHHCPLRPTETVIVIPSISIIYETDTRTVIKPYPVPVPVPDCRENGCDDCHHHDRDCGCTIPTPTTRCGCGSTSGGNVSTSTVPYQTQPPSTILIYSTKTATVINAAEPPSNESPSNIPSYAPLLIMFVGYIINVL